MQNPFDRLANELKINFMKFLPLTSIDVLGQTDTNFRQLANDEYLIDQIVKNESPQTIQFFEYAKELFPALSSLFLLHHIKEGRAFKGSGESKKGRGTLFSLFCRFTI